MLTLSGLFFNYFKHIIPSLNFEYQNINEVRVVDDDNIQINFNYVNIILVHCTVVLILYIHILYCYTCIISAIRV